jgi:hypothetical protein
MGLGGGGGGYEGSTWYKQLGGKTTPLRSKLASFGGRGVSVMDPFVMLDLG